MKRCPECRRDYYDDTLLYCLDDGNALLEGPAVLSVPPASAGGFLSSGDESATAILSEPPALAGGMAPSESPTRHQIHTTDQTAIFPRGAEAEPQSNLSELSERQSLSAHRAAEPQGRLGGRNGLLLGLALAVLLLVGGFFGYRYFKPATSEQINSIAVLPFENRSGNVDTDYLSDGLADSLIYRLSQLPNLKVSPTGSVMRYKGKEMDVEQVAKELKVDAVMSGRLVQRGDDLSISVQLTDARTEKLIWAEQYDRKMADLLATQREIAATISQKLQLKLSGEETGIAKKYTNNNEAYQLYLKGRFNWNKRTDAGLKAAVEYYNQAIEKDPGFALAYAGLADTYVITSAYGSVPPTEAMPRAKAAALKALGLDNTLAEPHAALGVYYAGFAWNFDIAERELRRATELNPNYATAWHWTGNFLPVLGKNDEAIVAARRAEELDPLSAIISADTGYDLILIRRYDDAVEQAKRTLSIDPNFWYAYYVMGLAYHLKGSHNEAITELRKSVELYPDPITKGMLATVLAGDGQRTEAQKLVNAITEESGRRNIQAYYLATAQLALGDKNAAIASLDRYVNDRGIYCQWLAIDPVFDGLRSDPRFSELIRKRDSMKLD